MGARRVSGVTVDFTVISFVKIDTDSFLFLFLFFNQKP